MSTEAPQTDTTPSHDKSRRPDRRRRLTGKIAAFAVLAGSVAGAGVAREVFDHEGQSQVGSSTDHPGTPKVHKPEKTPPPGPQRIEDLPGYGQRVSPEQRKALQAATVQVVRMKKNPGDEFATEWWCTGTKVSIGDIDGIVTSAHCLVNEGHDTEKAFPGSSSHYAANDPSLNTPTVIPESLSGEISVWTVGSDGKPDAQHPIRVITAAAQYNSDLAFLRTDENSPGASRLSAVPAVDYEKAILKQPEQGTSMSWRIAPGDGSDFRDVEGIYLGTTPYPGHPEKMRAWALVDKGDVVPGNSGSAAALGGAGITGPLSEKVIKPYLAKAVEHRLGVIADGPYEMVEISAPTQADVESVAQLAAAP